MFGISLIAGVIVSSLVSFFLIRMAGSRSVIAGDVDLDGPQKVHIRPVLRIGGVAIMMGMIAVGVSSLFVDEAFKEMLLMLLICAVPVFAAGLCEDFTRAVSPRVRLGTTLLGAVWAFFALNAGIARTGIPALDVAIQWTPASLALTVLLVSGLTHAVNIIDGLNGLASMSAMLMLTGIAAVAYASGDYTIASTALALAASVLGFFVWNFPRGLIFLGDGGAYLIGFAIAELSILLIVRNPTVSPWCPVLICAYPLIETLFSIYRRALLHKVSPSQADGLHLHTLVYKRLVRTVGTQCVTTMARQNSMAALRLWVLCLCAVLCGVTFRNNTGACMLAALVICLAYVGLYRMIVRFRAQKWLAAGRGKFALRARESAGR